MHHFSFENTVRLTESQYLDVWALVPARTLSRLIRHAALAVVGAIFLFSPYTLLLGIVILVLEAVSLFEPKIFPAGAGSMFRQHKYLRDALTCGVSEGKLWVKSARLDASVSWSMLASWRERGDVSSLNRRQTLRKTCAIILGFLLFGANQLPARGFGQAPSVPSAANTEPDELVLVGTVTKVYPLAVSRSRRRWAVVVNVDSVVSGDFSGKTFTFTVHSPSRAGLRVNGAYTIKATKAGGGYVVNELNVKEVKARTKPSGTR
jgi:hypothetical protein